MLWFFSDRHFTTDSCYLRISLEKWTREAENEAETNHVPQETGNLDAGIEKSKSKVRAFTCLHAAVRV